MSQRQACGTFGVARSSDRYPSIRPVQERLRARIREITSIRVSYGYQRVHLLRREALELERLAGSPAVPQRRTGATVREAEALQCGSGAPGAARGQERVLAHGLHGRRASGRRKPGVLTVLDTCTRECVALQVETTFGGQRIADVLTRVGVHRGLPSRITIDNGTEFASKALDHCACRNRLKLDYTRPGKSTVNGFIVSFTARAGVRACRTMTFRVSPPRAALGAWREAYNRQRPHSALGQRTLAEADAKARETMALESSAIAFLAPRASSKADQGQSEAEVAGAPARLALRKVSCPRLGSRPNHARPVMATEPRIGDTSRPLTSGLKLPTTHFIAHAWTPHDRSRHFNRANVRLTDTPSHSSRHI